MGKGQGQGRRFGVLSIRSEHELQLSGTESDNAPIKQGGNGYVDLTDEDLFTALKHVPPASRQDLV